MKDKKTFIKTMEYGKYLAFALATIFVIVSQFVGGRVWVMLSLSLYTVAFGFLFATFVIRLVELFNAGYTANDLNAEVLNPGNKDAMVAQESVEVVNLKSEKAWNLIGAIFFGLFAIFTFVVLILY